ncbi:hypothetical protein [Pseudonocardia sp. HH130630-07]|uniref:hypothetical protein n=1 Tax=Pseudonocardia sp. HH130630-07 TaxID=1690815 RepID=UPI000814BE86|nr:hypothetical protein [Pseudonocardia sp. HH130630-07]ANY08641.1 hypothetical protein AFB00_22885 [Pseudonocardia sp. HH130630-07]
MSPTRTPARRLAAVLLLVLVAVLAPVVGNAVAAAAPAPARAGDDPAPAAAPQVALPVRPAAGSAAATPTGDDGPPGHPGPELTTVLAAPVPGPAPARRVGATGAHPGHGGTADPRGPPVA